MEISYLYNIADRENIHIVNVKLKDSIGMHCTNGKINAIAIDYAQINTDREEKCILAEELGHYYCNATYPLSCTDETLIRKAECRAKKWSVKALLPCSALKKVKDMGLQYKWEIAEELGVTEDLVERAAMYYSV